MPDPRRDGVGRRLRSLGSGGSWAAGLLATAATALLLLAGPAAAATPVTGDVGDVHSPAPQSLLTMIALYGGIPAAGFLVAFLLSLRSGKKSDRYRPGQPWRHDPAWFGSSLEESQDKQEQRRRVALPGSGGASGRW